MKHIGWTALVVGCSAAAACTASRSKGDQDLGKQPTASDVDTMGTGGGGGDVGPAGLGDAALAEGDLGPQIRPGAFAYTPTPMTVAYVGHRATVLLDHTVLIAGGSWSDLGSANYAEIFDPVAKTFTRTQGDMTATRANHTQTALADGRVLLTGGANDFEMGLRSAEIYDPVTGTFTAAPEMTTWRTGHAAVLLPSGNVLIVGGHDGAYYLRSAEYYEPAANRFVPCSGQLNEARENATLTLLDARRVLVAGGGTGDVEGGADVGWRPIASAEIFDVETETFTPLAAAMATPREYHTATALLSGEVLLVGGIRSIGLAVADAERFDPATRTFRSAGRLQHARASHTATLLPWGGVLVVGGTADGISVLDAEIYDPLAATAAAFISAGALNQSRWAHAASVLPAGEVLVAGGLSEKDESSSGAGGPSDTAELYSEGQQ